MSADEPFAGHDGSLVLLLILACLIALVWLAFAGIRRLFRALAGRESPLSGAALFTWGATAAVYTWGLVLLMFADDYAEAQACEEAVGHHRLSGYEPTFLPLHFGCVTDDGQVVEALIPSWVNPSAALLGICASVLTVVHIAHQKKDTQT